MNLFDDNGDLIRIKRKRQRKPRCDSKYDEKYTKQLKSGIRYTEGLSQAELCHRWRICDTTFLKWCEAHPEFKEAYELSKMDYAAYWQDINKKVATGEMKGNAGCVIFALTNIEKIRWSTRVDVHNTSDEEVKKITIELLPGRKAALEHIQDEEIAELVVSDNVVQLLGKDAK